MATGDVLRFLGGIASSLGSISGNVASIASKGWGANVAQTKGYSKEEALGVGQMIDIIGNPLQTPQKLYDQVLNQLQNEAQLRVKINEETGLTGKLSEDVRRSILNSYPSVIQFGYGMEQLSGYYTTMIEKSGRWNIQNQESLIRSAAVSRAFVGDLSKMAEIQANIEKIGLGAVDAADAIEKAGIQSTSLGLRAKKTTEDINTSILKLNAYGFKNGIEGLAKMSRISAEFRMNMEETFKIADKVLSPEGAIELSSNLQVIGGILGDFNDPLKLMYMATNNVEGLQTALIEAAGTLATFNNEQGRFEITGINLRKAKAMAQELGVSYDELAKGAIASAERVQASTALMSTGLQMDKEDREFITNLSQMEGGQMVIKVPESLMGKLTDGLGKTITGAIPLNEITPPLLNELKKNREDFKKQDATSIAQSQLTLTEQIDRNVMAITASIKVRTSQALKSDFDNLNLSSQMQLLSSNLGVKVEELGNLEKLKIVPKMEEWVGKVRGLLISNSTDQQQQGAQMVKDALEKAKEAQVAERKSQVEIRHVHEYNASPTLLDNIGRFIARSPETWDEMYSSNTPEERDFLYSGGR
jgi:hypothetical protein